jgi:hypothetical protein
MKRNLVTEIAKKKNIKEEGLKVTLSRIKKRHDLRSIEQAACYYIKTYKIDINVSSIIDDITRNAIPKKSDAAPSTALRPVYKSCVKEKAFPAPRINWMPFGYYSLAQRLGEFYGYLFIFENALRLKINSVMSAKYSNWWNTKIRIEMGEIYNYSISQKKNQDKLPMLGQIDKLLPIDYVTVGQLEQIIIKYQTEFIPVIFPNLHFFTGHMFIIKRVRNALAHMASSTTEKDIKNAKNEINILLQHLSTL